MKIQECFLWILGYLIFVCLSIPIILEFLPVMSNTIIIAATLTPVPFVIIGYLIYIELRPEDSVEMPVATIARERLLQRDIKNFKDKLYLPYYESAEAFHKMCQYPFVPVEKLTLEQLRNLGFYSEHITREDLRNFTPRKRVREINGWYIG